MLWGKKDKLRYKVEVRSPLEYRYNMIKYQITQKDLLYIAKSIGSFRGFITIAFVGLAIYLQSRIWRSEASSIAEED